MIVRAALCVLVMLFAAGIVITNWTCVIRNLGSARKEGQGNEGGETNAGGPSMVPILSLILIGLAYLLCPFPHKIWMVIIPALDVGNWAVLVSVPVALFKGASSQESPDEANSESFVRPRAVARGSASVQAV